MDKHAMKVFFDTIPIKGKQFRERIGELENLRREKLENDLSDFVRDSKSWKAKEQEVQDWYTAERDKLAHECTDEFADAIKNMRDDIRKSVSRLDTASLYQLSALQNIPVTASELEVLIAKYNATDNYWNGKMLVQLAENNGIVSDRESLQLMPTADTMLSVLSEIEDEMTKMLADDYSEIGYQQLNYLRPKKCLAWERAFCNGLFEKLYSADDKASRLYTMLAYEPDTMQMGMKLQAFMMNCEDDAVKDRLLDRIAKDDTRFENAIALAGLRQEIADFKSGKREVQKEAPAEGEEVQLTDAEAETAKVLSQMASEK